MYTPGRRGRMWPKTGEPVLPVRKSPNDGQPTIEADHMPCIMQYPRTQGVICRVIARQGLAAADAVIPQIRKQAAAFGVGPRRLRDTESLGDPDPNYQTSLKGERTAEVPD